MAKNKAAEAAASGDAGSGVGTRLKLDPNNANRHTTESLTAVQLSVARLGAGRSIVADSSGTVIGGEATLKAAQQLGLPLREVRTNGEELVVVIREDLAPDDPRRTALAIADNQTAKLSDFDEEVLAQQLRGLSDDQDLLTATGFDDSELMAILNPDAAAGDAAGTGGGAVVYTLAVDCTSEDQRDKLMARLIKQKFACRKQ